MRRPPVAPDVGWIGVVAAGEPALPASRVRAEGPVGSDGRRLIFASWGENEELAFAGAGEAAAIVDGRIYGCDELAEGLRGVDPGRVRHADVVLALWREYGDEAIDALRGYFALVLFDSRTGHLLAARDTFNLQPLYWARPAGGEIGFSTDQERLVRLPGVSAEPSPEILGVYLLNRYPQRDETFLGDVWRVPSGCRTRFDGGAPRHHRSWLPRIPDSDRDWIREGAVEGLDRVLSRSIENAAGNERSGIYLSGGLDSVTVAAFTADLSARRGRDAPLALSLYFPGPFTEKEIQRKVAGQLGLEHIGREFYEAMGRHDGRILEPILAWSEVLPAPLQNFWAPGYATLGRAAHELGCRRIFTGGGGDEWLTVDPLYGADLMVRLRIAGLVRQIQTYRRSYKLDLLPLLRSTLWGNGLRPNLVSLVAGALEGGGLGREMLDRYSLRRWAARIPTWAVPDPTLRDRVVERAGEFFAERRWPRIGNWYLHLIRKDPHPLLSLGNEEVLAIGRRTGVRQVEPFWDPEVIDFLASVHPDTLNQGGWSKALVRRTLDRRFPGLGFRKQKKLLAGNLFTNAVVREAPGVMQRWDRLLLEEMGLVDRKGLHEFMNDLQGGTDIYAANRLWHVLNLETWTRARLSVSGGVRD